MLRSMDRITIYCVLCFVTFCALVLRSPDSFSIYALGGLIVSVLGLWFELSHMPEAEIEE